MSDANPVRPAASISQAMRERDEAREMMHIQVAWAGVLESALRDLMEALEAAPISYAVGADDVRAAYQRARSLLMPEVNDNER